MVEKCRLCPRYCEVNRNKGEIGYCGCGSEMVIARYSLHKWEEPSISGINGSGTIFFSYCNLRCVYCQNYDISTLHKGKVVTIEDFCDICLRLQYKGASNINLVTGVMYIPLIVNGVKLAKKRGLHIPIVYNTSGYESIEGLRLLDGIVDVYLTDLKYYDNKLGVKYSNVNNYFECATRAIEEMYRQVGVNKFDNNGIMVKGIIVRHLILPGCFDDSKKIIKYVYDSYKDNVYLSIMNQYTPIRRLNIDDLDRKITDNEYDDVIDYAYDMGVRKAYVQEGETQKVSFIPNFDEFEGIDS